MKMLIECYGNITNSEKIVNNINVGQKFIFDYLGEPLIVRVEKVENEFCVISTNQSFSIENNEKINITKSANTFNIPYEGETILAMPLYDASYKLKFSIIKESD